MKLENSREALHNAKETNTSKKNDKGEKCKKKKGSKKRIANDKRGNNPNKPHNGITDNKAPLPKYTNYQALNTPQDHIYAVSDKDLFRKPDEMRGNRSIKDIRKNYAYYKYIEHNPVKCNTLRDQSNATQNE